LNRIQVDFVECDISTLVDKVMPKGRLDLVNILDQNILGVIYCPWDRSSLSGCIPGFDMSVQTSWEVCGYSLSPLPLKVPPP
jgi:hypothetical protein